MTLMTPARSQPFAHALRPVPALRRMAAATLALLALGAAVSAMAAQPVYRQVGPDGRVTYSDRPLPAATPSASLQAGAASGDTTPLPYELRQIANRFPVVLYSASECPPCEQARRLLQQRGVPYTERAVQSPEDAQALQRISGSNSLPFATLGSQHLVGFETGQWTEYLNLAGYPSRSMLPEGYRFPSAQPLTAAQPATPAAAAPPAAAEGATPARTPATPPAGRATPSNPAGIVF